MANVVLRKLCFPMLGANRQASFLPLVVHVFLIGSQKEVVGFATSRDVAVVAHEQSSRVFLRREEIC